MIETTPTNADTFERDIADGVSIVYFSGEGCGFCTAVDRDLKAFPAAMLRDVTIFKIDGPNNPAICKVFDVDKYPHLLMIVEGYDINNEMIGYQSKSALQEFLECAQSIAEQ